ncbi:MAG: helix-turn-helix domain-containing protein [Myxococcota bacterium]
MRESRRRSASYFIVEVASRDIDGAVLATRVGADRVVTPQERSIPFPSPSETEEQRASSLQLHGTSASSGLLRARLSALATHTTPVIFAGETGSGRFHAARWLSEEARFATSGTTVIRPGATRPTRSLSKRVVILRDLDQYSRTDKAYWASVIAASALHSEHAPARAIATIGSDKKWGLTELAPELAQFAVHVAPLRERTEDVKPLADFFASTFSQAIERRRPVIDESAYACLQKQDWPRNLAQLKSVIERTVALTYGDVICSIDVENALVDSPFSVGILRDMRRDDQKRELTELLESTGGNIAEAARRLGLSRGAVIYRAQKFGLMPSRARSRSL